MSENDKINPESTELPHIKNLNTISLGEKIKAEAEAKNENIVAENVIKEIPIEDLDKKNYIKITPTFYIQAIKPEEGDDEDVELYKILNPQTGVVETRELTDNEKHEIIVHEFKESRIRFRNTIHDGNLTRTQFGVAYRKKRKRRNKLTKASRKTNRK
jgi:hypothetical protein